MKEELLLQLKSTKKHAETEYQFMKDEALKRIVDQYQHAINVLMNEKDRKLSSEDFCLWDCVAIYVNSIQDYTNPLIPELSKSKEMLSKYLQETK